MLKDLNTIGNNTVSKNDIELAIGKHLNKVIELTYSKGRVNTLSKEYVMAIKGKEEVARDYDDYISDMAISKAEHAIYHYEIMSSVKFTADKIMSKALEAIVTTECANEQGKAYIDLNVLAYKIGQKIAPKIVYMAGEAHRCTPDTKLTIGLNVCHFLAYIAGILHIESFKNAEGHTIKQVESNLRYSGDLAKIRKFRRAGTPMTCKPVEHTPEKAGGYTLDPKTMLNGKKFNDVKLQSQQACDVLNKAQNVSYSLRTQVPGFAGYENEPKWIGSNYRFMHSEWNKLLHDISILNGRKFYFPMAYDDRGRMYDRGNYVKVQGDKYQKALLQFDKKELLTARGEYYLKVAIASELYTDKCSTDEAVEWFNRHTIDELNAMTQTPNSSVLLLDYAAHLRGEAVGSIVHFD